jgi:hypothetical protein
MLSLNLNLWAWLLMRYQKILELAQRPSNYNSIVKNILLSSNNVVAIVASSPRWETNQM